MNCKTLVWIGAGGSLGALARYYAGIHISALVTTTFPVSTLLINWAGCLFLGFFLTIIPSYRSINPDMGLAIGTGFTGAFTTFSTFSLENIRLLQQGQVLGMAGYTFLSVCGGILLAWSGVRAGARLGRRLPDKTEG